MSFVLGFGMLLAISAEGVFEPVELFYDTLDIALAQSHTAIAMKFIAEESDITVAVAVAFAP